VDTGAESAAGRDDDEVDLLIDAWSDVLPDLDLLPLDVMSRLRRASVALDILRRAAFEEAGLAIWEFDVLAVLRRGGREMSPGELVAATGSRSGTMTHRIDRLLERGLVSQRENPNDARGSLVGLTDAGTQHVDAAMRALVGREETSLRDITPQERADLARLLRRLVHQL
jgi:DNA-binding MarR family transcriptional regulator